MLLRINLVFWLVAVYQLSFAQITTTPALPIETSAVTITFDSSKETKLGFYTSDLYAHTGVIVEGNTQWQHVIGSWGNAIQPKLTNKGGGIYELSIAPDIRTYYSVLPAEKVKKIAGDFPVRVISLKAGDPGSLSSKQVSGLRKRLYG